jgi:hypothetical protein
MGDQSGRTSPTMPFLLPFPNTGGTPLILQDFSRTIHKSMGIPSCPAGDVADIATVSFTDVNDE